jgi:hypothetical protein
LLRAAVCLERCAYAATRALRSRCRRRFQQISADFRVAATRAILALDRLRIRAWELAICKQASYAFHRMRPAAKEDAVAEVVCATCVAFARTNQQFRK